MEVILGTMTWGFSSQTSKEMALAQVNSLAAFKGSGDVILDTARMYQMGETESLIGQLLHELTPEVRKRVKIHTKAHPMVSSLSASGLRQQLTESLKALQLKCVDVFYLHAPDMSTPLEETLKTCNELHKEGLFVELGLSNYAAWDVVRAYYICQREGYCLPTIYQGCYNVLSRSLEAELLPAVRSFNIRCYVYNPIAGGFLSGKYKNEDDELTEGRFSADFDFTPKNKESKFKGRGHLFYRKRYFNSVMFKAINHLAEGLPKDQPMLGTSLKWLKLHSFLSASKGDGIIIGASKTEHCKQNLQLLKCEEPLSEDCLKVVEEAGTISKPVEESYFRGYGATPGRSEIYLAKF